MHLLSVRKKLGLVHVLLHRLNPAHPGPPVLSLGPSQLDYEFVKVGLAVWPVMSWTLYSALVASMMFQALGKAGIPIQMITTSEIKISVVIGEEHLEAGVRAVHQAFALDKLPHKVESEIAKAV